ncbi:hypothetical protein [Streptomyces acidiscabies]|uniref:hypothetical protein n=1 Tax=Streptomyces acidiscabies TaxID=42234 RepID=UPI0038F5F93E
MRRVLTAVVAAVAGSVFGGGVAVAGPQGGGVWGVAPEADLAYHGAAVMGGGRMEVRFAPRNHGPSGVADSAVRLRWSVPLAAGTQGLPGGCVRVGVAEVVCRTGALAADAPGERIEVGVRLRGRPEEVVLEVETAWSGGTVDRNRENDRQRVLVLDTGDVYYF